MATITTTMDAVLPSLIDVDVFEQAVANTNWNTISVLSDNILNAQKQSSGAQNDEISFDVVLIAGTWDVELLHYTNTNRGIYSIQFDGIEKGTIDGYSGSLVNNVRSSVTGITVSTTGKVRLKLKMATKNASSSGYYGVIAHIQLRCTSVSDTSSVKVDPDTHMPWLIDVNVFMTAISHVNWDSNSTNTNMIRNGYHWSSGAQNDEISFDLPLAAGTWDVELLYSKSTSNGIVSVQFDGVEKGTIDQYAATIHNQRSSVTGIAVVSTGNVRLKLKMATKNASSSNYYGYINHIQLRRTV